MNSNFNIDKHLSHRQMTKALDFVQDFYNEYNKRAKKEQFPCLINPFIHQRDSEGFHLSYYKREISLEADSPLAAIYAISQLTVAVQSQYLPHYLGPSHPRYPIRPIWLCGDSLSLITDYMALALPNYLSNLLQSNSLEENSAFKALCAQILQYGFNTVILGHSHLIDWVWTQSSSYVDIPYICQAFQTFGLKVIIKPFFRFFDPLAKISFTLSPFDSHFRHILSQALQEIHKISSVNGVFWETSFHHPQFAANPDAQEVTFKEIILEEMKLIEQLLRPDQDLIYYLSCYDQETAYQQAQWLPFLCDYAGSKTSLAFSAVAGDPCADHLPLHPFWEVLRQSPDASSTPLFPLLNVGAIHHGEGFWPSISIDLMDEVLNRCTKHPFAGIIGLTNRIPTAKGLLSCHLWILGQSLWRSISPSLLVETWFKAYRPDLNYPFFKDWLKIMGKLVIDLGFLRTLTNERKRDGFSSEDCQIKADYLLTQLRYLQSIIRKEACSLNQSYASFADYFLYFQRDARRIILHSLQGYNLSLSNILIGDDLQSSFWTSTLPNHEYGARNGIKIHFHSKPCVAEKDLIMEKIYQENTLLNF